MKTILRPKYLKKYPTNLNFELTTRCNLKCAYCARGQVVKKDIRNVGDMDFDLVKKVIDEFSVIQQKNITINPVGLGDPLLYPRLIEVLRLLRQRIPNAFIYIATNAIALTHDLSKKLIDSGLDSIGFSVNCWGREIYKQIHGVDKFEQVVRNVKNFLLMKGPRSPRAIVEIMNIDVNKGRMGNFRSFWKQLLNENDQIYVRLLGDWAGKVSTNQFLDEPIRRKKRFPCPSLFTTVMIDKEGFIYPCCLSVAFGLDTDLCLGNIKEVSLKEVYDKGEKIQILRRLQKENRYDSIYPCNLCRIYLTKNPPNYFIEIGSKWI